MGRGLSALLGGGAVSRGGGVEEVSVELIDRNPFQPRRVFDESKLEELAASIRESGILQPLLVRKAGTRYQLISGERRLQAAKMAGLSRVPVLFKDVDDEQMLMYALVENLQRDDLNPMEAAHAIARLIDDFGLTHAEAAERLGLSRSYVSNLLRLRRLPAVVQSFVEDGRLSFGHAKVLAGMEDEEGIVEIAKRVVAEKLSVRMTERLVASYSPRTAGSASGSEEEVAPSRSVPRGTSVPLDVPRSLKLLLADLSDEFNVRLRKGSSSGVEVVFRCASMDEAASLLKKMRDALEASPTRVDNLAADVDIL